MLIYKQSLTANHIQSINIPQNSKILSVKTQKDDIVVYYEHKDEPTKSVIVYVVPTGSNVKVSNIAKFLDTVMMYDGTLVFHIFIEE